MQCVDFVDKKGVPVPGMPNLALIMSADARISDDENIPTTQPMQEKCVLTNDNV